MAFQSALWSAALCGLMSLRRAEQIKEPVIYSSPREHAVSVRRGGFQTLTVHHKMNYLYMWHDFMARMLCTYHLGFSEGRSGRTLLQIAGLLIFEDTGQMSCMFHWMEEENPTFQVWSMNSDGNEWCRRSFVSGINRFSSWEPTNSTKAVGLIPSVFLGLLGASKLQRTLHQG